MARDPTAPGGILTLDLATRSGWAYGHASARLTRPAAYGAWDLGNGRAPARWAALADKLADTLTIMQPRLVVFEAPLPPQAQTRTNIARMLWGLCSTTELICYRRRIACKEQDAPSARKALIGNGRPEKDTIVSWCQARGLADLTDHNAADAVVLWYYAAALGS